MRWEAKNLQQFLASKKDDPEVWKWVHIAPTDTGTLWLASNVYNLGSFDGPEIPGLKKSIVIEDGKGFLDLVHEHGHHEMTLRHTNHLILEWWIKTKIETIATESNEQAQNQYEQVKHSASVDTRPRTDRDPNLERLRTFWLNQPRKALLETAVEATQARLVASMKEGAQATAKPARVVSLASRGSAVTMKVHGTQNFQGVLTLNSLHTHKENNQ